jgi:hypothetical protein
VAKRLEAPAPSDEYLNRDDLKALDLIGESLGLRAKESARLLLIREHAKRIIPVTTDQIRDAMAYLDGTPRTTGSFNLLIRKFVLEDKGLLLQCRSYLNLLLDSNGVASKQFMCNDCNPATSWKNLGALSVHRARTHKIKGSTRRKR